MLPLSASGSQEDLGHEKVNGRAMGNGISPILGNAYIHVGYSKDKCTAQHAATGKGGHLIRPENQNCGAGLVFTCT